MRTLHNYIAAAKQRREDGEAGFSLIELIVVVAILGILVAIAIPVFSGIQQSAKENAAKTVAANAVTAVAAVVAQGKTPTSAAINNLKTGNVSYIAVYGVGTLDTICATAIVDGTSGEAGKAGGCSGTAITAGTAPVVEE